ncbi:MAG: hypothetical protein AAFO04_04125 [Cyanobacteria bacterium J06592_8]
MMNAKKLRIATSAVGVTEKTTCFVMAGSDPNKMATIKKATIPCQRFDIDL